MDNLPQSLLFFICVPIYKAEKYIDKCIQSVLNQTYPHFKLILVDDGSPDHCGEICDNYAKQDDRITVIHQENLGQIAARQAGRLMAKQLSQNSETEYVIFVDSDDSLEPNALSVAERNIRESGCDMLIYGLETVQNGVRISNCSKEKPFIGIIEDKKVLYHLVLEDYSYNPLWRKAIGINLLTDEKYTQFIHRGGDLFASIDIYSRCKKVAFIGNKLYNYENNPDSITHSVNYEKYVVDTTVVAKALAMLQKEGVWDERDFAQYFRFCRRMLWEEIIKINGFKTTQENKNRLYDEICKDSYYAYLLHETNCKEPLLLALRGGRYGVISCYFTTRRKLGRIKASIKKAISGKSK